MAKKYTWTDDTPQGFLNDELEDIHDATDAIEDRIAGINEDTTDEVGVGTSSPSHELDVAGTIAVSGSGSVDASGANPQIFRSGAGDLYIHCRPNSGKSLRFFTNNEERLTIRSDGDVGVGAGSPAHSFHVIRSTGNVGLGLEGTGTNQIVLVRLRNNRGIWDIKQAGGAHQFRVVDVSNGNIPLKILGGAPNDSVVVSASGDVGIGTTAPDGAFDVSSTTGGLVVPRMTTTQRDALSPVAGTIIFNTSTSKHEGYDGSSWNAFY